jgi:hypothetical protein
VGGGRHKYAGIGTHKITGDRIALAAERVDEDLFLFFGELRESFE